MELKCLLRSMNKSRASNYPEKKNVNERNIRRNKHEMVFFKNNWTVFRSFATLTTIHWFSLNRYYLFSCLMGLFNTTKQQIHFRLYTFTMGYGFSWTIYLHILAKNLGLYRINRTIGPLNYLWWVACSHSILTGELRSNAREQIIHTTMRSYSQYDLISYNAHWLTSTTVGHLHLRCMHLHLHTKILQIVSNTFFPIIFMTVNIVPILFAQFQLLHILLQQA